MNVIKNSEDRLARVRTIAAQFADPEQIQAVRELGSGNVNDTYLVSLNSADDDCFVLQQLNTQVFQQPELVMHNMRVLTDYVGDRLTQIPQARRWEVPQIRMTQSGEDYWRGPDHSFWRGMSYVQNAHTFDAIQNLDHGTEVGYGLGLFHRLLSQLPATQLADTLVGFHITPNYVRQYQQILAQQSPPPSPEVNYCLNFIRDRQDGAGVLEQAKAQGHLHLRPIHGDPKVNNIMIDTVTGQAVSLIDLDTVKPGLIHYDIGDCLRSGCNPLGEETQAWEAVRFEPELGQAILQGYLTVAQDFLTPHDYEYLFVAMRLIAFELGLRFFTDYLAGDVYFKVHHPEHNLARALVQFKLTESIEAQAQTIQSLIQDLR